VKGKFEWKFEGTFEWKPEGKWGESGTNHHLHPHRIPEILFEVVPADMPSTTEWPHNSARAAPAPSEILSPTAWQRLPSHTLRYGEAVEERKSDSI
jgi:hypothetical protein